MNGLEVSGLNYSYGPKSALIDVSFAVPKGTFCALLGPNGAGKSTLFNLLTRLFTGPSGDIRIAGHDLKSSPREALSRLGIVFQQPTLDLDLSVRQNLLYFAALHGLSGPDARKRIEVSLNRLDMLERAGEKVRSLNGGHRRRTEIARALVPNPEVLLLDEPTVGLDAASRHMITDHVHALAHEGTTVLWATHLTDEIRPDDYLVILHQARVLQTGTARDICADTPLQQRFLQMTGGRDR
ncbi:MAG: ABC transporter ATP-binding protein [Roseobacter sp.]|jgi:ABC-2 type transport system ATP-binding protein